MKTFKNQGINFPLTPAKFPFFYGWVVIVLGILGVLMSIPGQTIGVSAFTDPLLQAFGIKRTSLTFAYMLGTGISGLIITYAGSLYDRYGARIIAAISSILLALSLVFLTRLENIEAFFRIHTDYNPEYVIIVLLIFGFFAIRFFGQGVLTMVSRNMVMKWFDRRRGFANSFLGTFTALGFSLAPALLFGLVEKYTWKGAWLVLAFIIGIPFVIIIILFFRDNPEQCNLKPDGEIQVNIKKKRTPLTRPIRDYNLGEAIRTYSFWIYNLTMVMHGLFITAFTFNVESIFQIAGMDKQTAFSIFVPVAIISVIVNFLGSWISDFIKLKYLLIAYLAALIITMGSLQFLGDSQVALWLLIAGSGIASGMFSIMVSVVWPRFFGTTHLGKISGFSTSCIVIGTAIGPFLFSLSEKFSGSYSQASMICLVITIILLGLSFKANNVNQTQY